MKQRILTAVMALFMSAMLTACSTTDTENKEQPAAEEQTEEPAEARTAEGKFESPESKPADLSEMETVSVDIYYVNDSADGFEIVQEDIYSRDISQILEKLAEYDVLPKNIGFYSMKTDMVDGEMVIELDMREAFAEYMQAQNAGQEQMLMGSLSNTLLRAFEAEKVKILVAGERWKTEYQEYGDYMSFYE